MDVEDLGNVLAGAMKAQVCIGVSFRSEFCKLLPHKGLAESWWKATIHIRQVTRIWSVSLKSVKVLLLHVFQGPTVYTRV